MHVFSIARIFDKNARSDRLTSRKSLLRFELKVNRTFKNPLKPPPPPTHLCGSFPQFVPFSTLFKGIRVKTLYKAWDDISKIMQKVMTFIELAFFLKFTFLHFGKAQLIDGNSFKACVVYTKTIRHLSLGEHQRRRQK